ncbi:hypothetical protein [Methylobacterium radiotolerans]|uniref:hypothetical protein n=1 Tax=Methylobacterium radiotolerans TaxID=31998 RepID=UPI0038D114DB
MAFSNKNAGGGGGPLPPSLNVAFEVLSYDVKDRNHPSVDDTFQGIILTEAFGHPEGTEFTFKMRSLPPKGENIHGMAYGSSKPKLPPTSVAGDGVRGGQGIAEGAYVDRKSGVVVMNWLTMKVRQPETNIDQLLVGQYFSVDSERKNNKTGRVNQSRYMYDVINAPMVPKVDAQTLLSLIGPHLETPAANLGGVPGFMLRGIDLNNFRKGAFQATRFSLPRVEEGGQYRDATAIEAIERFLESDHAKRFMKALTDPNDPVENPYIDIIPYVRIRTGKDSLPSEHAQKKDDSRFFKLPVPDTEYFDYYIGRGNTHIRWQDPKSEGGEGSFFSTLTLPMQRYETPMYAPEEIPTPNLPQEVADFFHARAEEIGRKIAPRNNPGPASAPAADEPSTGPAPR